jgi:hypothetical protein
MHFSLHDKKQYTSQQKKRYKGLGLNIFYIEKKNRQKSYNLDSYGRARVEQNPTSFYPTIDWFYASEVRSCRCCKRWSHTLLNSANLHTTWQFLIVHDLLILLILPYLLFPYESKDVIKVSLLQKGQNDSIKTIVSVYYVIQCSLNNFELSATIMPNSSPDHNTSASKTVGLVHTLVCKTFYSGMSLCHMSTIMSQLCHCWNSHVIEQYTIIRLIHLRSITFNVDTCVF